MKPLNLDNSPCSPMSSNCIIWQGPDIPCIKLCKGDTISDVVFKLATELCTIMDMLNVNNYDISCFNLTACKPNDFQALIQFIIDQLCSVQNTVNNTPSSTTTTTSGNVPKSTTADTLVTVASCFVVGGQTVMSITDYAIAIGNKVCSIVDQISIINAQIFDLQVRVTNIENTPIPTPATPSFTLSCAIGSLPGGSNNFISTILQEFINNVWCGYVTATGSSSDILSAVGSICIADTDLQLTSGTAFSTNPFWIQNASYSTLSDAVNNLWVALCDVYNYAESLGVTVADTATVNLDMTSNIITANISDTGWVDLFGFDFYSTIEKPQVRRIGNQLHFRGQVVIPLENPASPGNVIVYNTPTVYNSTAGCTPWTGTGGCTVNITDGSLQFNNGGSAIPPSITVGLIDGTYSDDKIMIRQINLNGTYGTTLSSVATLSINANGTLAVATLKDKEASPIRTAALGSSQLRFITSNVRAAEYVPNYIAAASDISNAPSNANFPLVSDTFNLVWPFTCDAAEANQVGGFAFKIDGLIAYLEPCNVETGLSTTCFL